MAAAMGAACARACPARAAHCLRHRLAVRVRLASDYLDREMARRGVQATYEVKRIGFGTQILENCGSATRATPICRARGARADLIGFTGPMSVIMRAALT